MPAEKLAIISMMLDDEFVAYRID